MAIDGVGKGGKAFPLPGGAERAEQASRTGGAKEAFRVDRPPAEISSASAVSGAAASSPLERLRAGHLDVNGYVDAKVSEATAHLEAHGLPKVQLESIQKMLRDQLATDPALADLVKQATGSAASVPEE